MIGLSVKSFWAGPARPNAEALGEPSKELSAKIVQWCLQEGKMTQMRLAALLEVDQSLVSMIAAAKRNLTMENLERLSQIAGLPTPILVWKAIGQPRNLSAVQQRVFKKVDAILRRAFPEFRKATDVSGQGKTGLPGNAVT